VSAASVALTLGAAPQFFQVTPGAAGGLLDAMIAAGGSAVRLTLLDGGGNIVVQSDGTSTSNGDPRVNEHVKGGPFYLEAQSLAGPGFAPVRATLTYSLITTTDPFASIPGPAPVSDRIAVGDLNGDGVLDYVTGAGVYLGARDGTFASEPAAPLPGISVSDPSALATGMFTGDGRTELAVAVSSDVTLFRGDALGALTALDASPVELADGATVIAMAAVASGVGLDDLAVLIQGPAGRFVEILRNEGAGTFQPSSTIPVDPAASGLAAGRFNGDAATDLAVLIEGGTSQQGAVVIFRGNGRGAFRPGPTIAIAGGDELRGIVAGDFNGDGHVGLAVSGTGIIYGTGNITLLSDDGHGSFAVEDRIPVTRSLARLAAGDFNGDGRIDLIATNLVTPDVTILLGRGDGTYRDASPPDFAPLAVADVNGDGVPDEITPLGVFLGVGDGSYRTPSKPLPVAGTGVSAILAAPLVPGDSGPDLAVANYDRSEVTILQEAGDGTFRPVETVRTGGHPAALAAVPEDGRTDLAVVDPSSGTVTLLVNDRGVFRVGQVLSAGLRPVALEVTDLNGDGNADLVVVDQGDGVTPGAVTIFLGNGDAMFHLAGSIPVGVQPSSIAAADFNGDGRTDLAVTNLASGSVSVLIGQGDARFRSAAPVDLGVGTDPVAVVAYSPGPGGAVNLVVAERGTLSVAVLAGGDGTFHALPPVLLQQTPLGLAVARFTAGPFPGLAVSDRTSADVAVMAGNRDGSFGSQGATSLGPAPTGIVAARFDADGVPDLAIANSQSNTISILLGNGDGTFRNGETIPVGTFPYPLAAGDFNGDGRTDLAVGDFGDGTDPGDVRIFLGNGDGTFRAGQTIPLGIGTFSIVVSDFNRDGHADLAVVDLGPQNGHGTVWVLLGNGDGTFRVDQSYTVGGQAVSVEAGDFNRDGRTDLAVADAGWPGTNIAGDVMVLWGDGTGRFPTSSTIDYRNALDPYPQVVVGGDFLGQGRTELAVLSQYVDNTEPGDVTLWAFNRTAGFRAVDRVALPLDDLPIYMAAGDFNGDGRRGLAVVDYYDEAVTVLTLAPGSGLEAGDPVSIGGAPGAIAVVDFNGDGLPDFAVPTQFPGALSVRLNRGEGIFSPPGDTTLAAHDTVLPVDLGTGVTDLLSVDASGNILWRRGQRDAPGTFNPPLTINPGAPSRGIALVSDQRSKGRWIVSIDLLSDTLSVYSFQGGRFQRTGSLPTGKLPVQVLSADINGDGISDLVVPNAGDGTCSVYYGRGAGIFVAGPVVTLGPNVSDVTLAALGGTGVLDLIATDAASGTVTVLHNDGNGSFGAPSIYRAGTAASSVTTADDGTAPVVTSGDQTGGVAVAMLSRSGNPSLVAIDPGGHSLAVLDGLGAGRFANPRVVDRSTEVQIVRTFAARAGGPGSYVAALGPDGLEIYQDDGAGGLTLTATYDVGPDATGLAVADLNGDGANDVLVGNRYGDVLVLYGDGTGAFQPYVRADQRIFLAVARFASDGLTEFAFSNKGLDRASVGIGTAAPAPLPIGPLALRDPGPVALAYLGGTASPDLILVNSGGNTVMVYPGLGNGRFGVPLSYTVGEDPVSVTVADVNGDGIPDLVVANHGSNDVSVLIGAVTGGVWSPTSQLRLKAGYGPTSVAVAPVLGGPYPDIVVTNGLSNEVRVLRALGGGFFDDVNPLVYSTGSDPVAVVVLEPSDGSSTMALVTLNAASNDLTFVVGIGSAFARVRTFDSGGELPLAAVVASDPLTGTDELLVANSADGLLALFQVSADGLDLVDTFTAPGLTHPTALAVDAFGDIFGVNSGTEGAVLISLGLGASGGLEEQLVARLDSFGGVALAATLSTVLAETTGIAGEAMAEVVAVAVPGPIPQMLGTIPIAGNGPDELDFGLAGEPEESEPPAQSAQGRGLPDEIIDILLGEQDDLDDLRRDIVQDLLRDGGLSYPTPRNTGETSGPASTPSCATVNSAGKRAAMLEPRTPTSKGLVEAAIGSLLAEPSAIETDGSETPVRSSIGLPLWALAEGTLGMMTLPLVMADCHRRRRRRGGTLRWVSILADDGLGSPR
jgi:hypothetical protein